MSIEKANEIITKADLPDRHTFFQIEKFIIGKEPTTQSQLWAIVREIQARKETIENFDKDLLDTEDNLELLDIRIESLNRLARGKASDENHDLNIQQCEINIRKLIREKEHLVKAAQKLNKKRKSILEELNFLVAGYEQIVAKYGEMKPMDDEESQKEMWNEKLLEEFNLRIILQRPFDPEFIKTALCLHDDALVKKQTVALLNRMQSRMLPEKKPSVDVKAKITGK